MTYDTLNRNAREMGRRNAEYQRQQTARAQPSTGYTNPVDPTKGIMPGVQPDQFKGLPTFSDRNINPYETGSYSWDPMTMGDPQQLQAQNYDLMRQGALRNVNQGVQSGMRTGMASLAASGGLSAADRQAFAAQGQRQRVQMGQGATSGYDQMASQNLYDTQKFNLGQQQQTMDMNQDIWNSRNRDVAGQNELRSVNIYQQRLKEALLERQLDAARKIAREQGA